MLTFNLLNIPTGFIIKSTLRSIAPANKLMLEVCCSFYCISRLGCFFNVNFSLEKESLHVCCWVNLLTNEACRMWVQKLLCFGKLRAPYYMQGAATIWWDEPFLPHRQYLITNSLGILITHSTVLYQHNKTSKKSKRNHTSNADSLKGETNIDIPIFILVF